MRSKDLLLTAAVVGGYLLWRNSQAPAPSLGNLEGFDDLGAAARGVIHRIQTRHAATRMFPPAHYLAMHDAATRALVAAEPSATSPAARVGALGPFVGISGFVGASPEIGMGSLGYSWGSWTRGGELSPTPPVRTAPAALVNPKFRMRQTQFGG